MAFPYIGEIRMFAGNFAPAGWALCDGQLLPIAEHDTLFILIGTTFGGDGQTTFALPDLRSRIPIHMGSSSFGANFDLGETGGSEQITLTGAQVPAHSHPWATSVVASKTSPVGNLLGDTGINFVYADGEGAALASGLATASVGGSQPHDNMMPFTCVNFIISLFGLYPSQF